MLKRVLSKLVFAKYFPERKILSGLYKINDVIIGNLIAFAKILDFSSNSYVFLLLNHYFNHLRYKLFIFFE